MGHNETLISRLRLIWMTSKAALSYYVELISDTWSCLHNGFSIIGGHELSISRSN